MVVIVYVFALALIAAWRFITWKLDPVHVTGKDWLRTGVLMLVLMIGWLFIGWQNRFYLSPPLVFVMLGYLAVVMTVYNLWRTGAAAVAEPDDSEGDGWARPAGAVDELDREKRTLLKAIKEAEFDHEMGKLSKADADGMIKTYRARAIEVIKEIERAQVGAAGTKREQIEREVKARLEVEGKAKQKVDKQKKKSEQATGNRQPAAGNSDAEPEKTAEPVSEPEKKADKVVERDAETVESGGHAVVAAAAEEAKDTNEAKEAAP